MVKRSFNSPSGPSNGKGKVPVTPSTSDRRQAKKIKKKQRKQEGDDDDDDESRRPDARRVLFDDSITQSPGSGRRTIRSSDSTSAAGTSAAALITPSKPTATKGKSPGSSSPAKRRLIFGRYVDESATTIIPPNVSRVYKLVHKLTGSIGGNGYSGPIYGELTCHSMQKVVDKMIETTNFGPSSRFIDVGSGIGKPNLHVAQYPGVGLSVGVEMEYTRWTLGMTCLKAVVDEAVRDDGDDSQPHSQSPPKVRGNTMFLHKNILEASTFDPFTHVYMFSIGFPPELWIELSKMWNTSSSSAGGCNYLICYHSPKNIIDEYEFDVELVTQLSTSMHGSKEGHMAYIYKRSKVPVGSTDEDDEKKEPDDNDHSSSSPSSSTSFHQLPALTTGVPCDPVFSPSYELIAQGNDKVLQDEVCRQVSEVMDTGRSTRSTNRVRAAFSRTY